MTPLLRRRVLVFACAVTLPYACQRANPHGAASQAGSGATPGAYDRILTDRARVLAGLVPEQADRYRSVTTLDAWLEWQKEFDLEWNQAAAGRFAAMADWRQRHLGAATRGCDVLLYPFSGPDILNALILFPDCRRYVLFGLEHTGSLPVMEHLPKDRVARLIEETRHALGDLLTRNYAITRHMMKDMETPELHGNLPLLAVFLVRLDARLVSVRDVEIAEDGSLRSPTGAAATHRTAPALEIVFERRGREPQSLIYFRAQAEDTAIRQRPGVLVFLERQAPFVTFLKSASYLLHGSQFTIVRDLLLARSQAVLQDDSGIPLRFLRPPEWAVVFFGRYQKPVKDFNYGYQPDLALAYGRQQVEPLTFSFGYHWESGSSTMMLATRTARPAASPR